MVSLYSLSLSLSLSQISHSVSRPAFTKFSTILVPLTYYTHRRVSMLYNSYISIHEGGYISTTNLRPFDEFEPGQICTKETMSILQVQRHSLSTLSQRKQRLMESWQKGFYSIITHDPLWLCRLFTGLLFLFISVAWVRQQQQQPLLILNTHECKFYFELFLNEGSLELLLVLVGGTIF